MQSLSLHENAAQNAQPDLELQISKLELLLAERRAELVVLQQELREFKEQYAQIVGGRLAELGEVERSIKEAEARLFDLEMEADAEDDDAAAGDTPPSTVATGKSAMRKLFWSVARLFHPDHAADEQEASRRHAVMAEASRAYQEGDVESLHTLLGDEQLQFFCTTQRAADEGEEDLASQFLRLKGELNTVEFGIKRIRQDGLSRLKLKVDEDARAGRDALAQMAENIDRQITKARRRLEHLGG